jgi:energy-coupling factor transport system ATP-binding protein
MSIEVKNLKYTYNPGMPGETLALDDVSFEVHDGETIGIIGHTGSGKSTLLQHLNGLIRPDSGEVWVDGQCITDKSAKLVDVRRKVGLVFQYPEYQLFEETVAKDIAFGPRNTGIPEDQMEKRVRAAMSIVGLDYDEIAESSPCELSGGQKRRVAIAGVVAMRPSVLILDEPTAGLDPAAHDEVLAMIETINASMNMIVIFVSHNMADVARLSDRVLVMDKGKIAMQGTPREVFSHEDELSSMGLGVPPVRDILKKIKEAVPGFESDALTTDEAAEDIRKYFGLKQEKA